MLKDMIDRANVVINNLKQSFLDGCKMIVDRLTVLGYAPSSPQGPAQIVDAINAMYGDRYNKGYADGREQGRNDVIADPESYGIALGVIPDGHMAIQNTTETAWASVDIPVPPDKPYLYLKPLYQLNSCNASSNGVEITASYPNTEKLYCVETVSIRIDDNPHAGHCKWWFSES